MFYHDLHEEVRYLKSRLHYKSKKLEEALSSSEEAEAIKILQTQIKEIEQKLQVCNEELRSQNDTINEEWKNGLD